jgi:hypothetical protein
MTITETRLRRLFQDRGFRVHEVRRNRHWWAKVARQDGGPLFSMAVSLTPSDRRFEHMFERTLILQTPAGSVCVSETVVSAGSISVVY